MESCIFCKMVSGEVPIVKIWEDEKYLAFLDNHPIQSGHTLIIPKKHTDYVFGLDDTEYTELMLNAKRVAEILKSKLKSKKVGMIIEGFAIPHAHVHLVPINGLAELNPDAARLDTTFEELNQIGKTIVQ